MVGSAVAMMVRSIDAMMLGIKSDTRTFHR